MNDLFQISMDHCDNIVTDVSATNAFSVISSSLSSPNFPTSMKAV